MHYRLGIDLGGTKIEIIALDAQGESVFSKRVATPKGDYLATLNTIANLVSDAESFLQSHSADVQIVSLGLGIPGSISARTGLVRNANSTVLIGKNLKADLEQKLNRPVNISNDANCFALSEAMDGAASHAKTVFGVIIGTGCGGALVVNQQVLDGANLIAGEWGHNPLPWLNHQVATPFVNLECYCGLSGCQETFLSGSGVQRHYQHRTGQDLTTQQIVALSEQGDVTAQQLIDDYVVWLAKALAAIINVFDPDAIVLGGGMSNVQRLYQDVPAIWDQWIFNNEPAKTQLLPPKFGDASGVRGAAWL